MDIIAQNVDSRMLEEVNALRGEVRGNYAMHFRLFALQEMYKSEFQQRIVVNILNDIFRKEMGYIFKCRDGDVLVLYKGENKLLLEKAEKSVRYLFEDDPHAYLRDGSDNHDFSVIYDLGVEWRVFYRVCAQRSEFSKQVEIKPKLVFEDEDEGVLTPMRLASVVHELNDIDFNLVIRKQPICAIKSDGSERVVYHELYVNIGNLGRILPTPCDLASDRWLFGHLSEVLDKHVLDMISDRPQAYIDRPISLNLNVSSILSQEFEEFCDLLRSAKKESIVVEVQIADVFEDIRKFLEAKDIVQERGFRLCLDGLTTKSFVQIDRAALGFDLAKVRWNADLAADLDLPANKLLAESVEKCGSNRIILCRCDTEHAIDYGHALGISLFQGRYPDKVINPNSRIEN